MGLLQKQTAGKAIPMQLLEELLAPWSPSSVEQTHTVFKKIPLYLHIPKNQLAKNKGVPRPPPGWERASSIREDAEHVGS